AFELFISGTESHDHTPRAPGMSNRDLFPSNWKRPDRGGPAGRRAYGPLGVATTRPVRVSRFLPGASSALCSWPRKPWTLGDGPWRRRRRLAVLRAPSAGMPPRYAARPAGAPAPWPLPQVRDRRPLPAFVPGPLGPQG